MKRVSIKDVAREAGVSATTVSYVLNRNPSETISAETTQRVLEAFTDRLAQNPLYRLAVSPGLYGWVALMSAVWLLRGNRGRLLCAVPALFTLAGCLLSAVNGYFRYAMPLYLSAPLLLWLVAEARFFPKSH